MSFFDDVDETRVEPPPRQQRARPEDVRRAADRGRPASAGRRRASAGGRQPGGSGRPPSGGGRRPPPRGGARRAPVDEHTIRVRRATALITLVVVLVLVAVGVHSCQVSATNNALRDYSDNVAAVIQSSDQTGRQFFTLLASGQGSSNAPAFTTQIDDARHTAFEQLRSAEGFSVPDQMKPAQTDLLLALRMRNDAIANIAQDIQPALQPATSSTAVSSIAAEMARFYASDVVYKDYALPAISAALHAAGIAVGGAGGQQLNEGQFLPSIEWLQPTYIAAKLRVTLPSGNGGKPAPGIHGHELDSCSVGGTTLQTGATNTIPASPPPTFTCTITNDGQNTETNVVVKVVVTGTSISGEAIIPQTQPGQQYTAQITLGASPPMGTYNVNATVERVPGETVLTHNTKIFPVTFR